MSEFLVHWVVQGCLIEKRKISIFATYGTSWILVENKKVTVRDRAILSEFLVHWVVQGCLIEKRKISIFATYGPSWILVENKKV